MAKRTLQYPLQMQVHVAAVGRPHGYCEGVVNNAREVETLILNAYQDHLKLVDIPEWHDNDVVSVEFPRADGTTNGQKYSYMRADGYWPGSASWSSKSDGEITDLWQNGHVELLVRDGERWDPAARP